MNILVVTPASPGSRQGNRVTALRWAKHLRALGHHVRLAQTWDGQACDTLVALHARKSAASIARFRDRHPSSPVAVALTGTDLYQDLPLSLEARTSLEYGDRLILLQPVAVDALPPQVRSKARVIFQSASPAHPTPAEPGTFQVCVLAHLRDVKDPFLAARAARLLPERSRLRIVHLGAALDVHGEAEARTEMASNARYRWVGERRRNEALSILAGSRLLLVTSRLEGGANVVSEAIASTVPVLSTRIDGSLGILGSNYLGYFPVGDAGALAGLLQRAEEEKGFMASLLEGVARVRPLVEPVREREAWRALLGELVH